MRKVQRTSMVCTREQVAASSVLGHSTRCVHSRCVFTTIRETLVWPSEVGDVRRERAENVHCTYCTSGSY